MKILLFIAFIVVSCTVFAQSIEKNNGMPVVGHQMPNFTLNEIYHYKVNKASLTDFKGKWLFLDFWSTGCTACVASFPKVSGYQQQFGDSIQYMMVGLIEWNLSEKGIKQFYEGLNRKHHYQIPCAFDSVLYYQYGGSGVPLIIIIDPAGIVRAITNGQDMSSEKIRDLIAGREVSFFRYDWNKLPEFAGEDPSHKNGLKESLIYRSILQRWTGQMEIVGDLNQYASLNEDPLKNDSGCHSLFLKGYSISKIPLTYLYNEAYWGEGGWSMSNVGPDSDYKHYWEKRGFKNTSSLKGALYIDHVLPEPILELKDSSAFQFDYDDRSGPGLLNYQLIYPQAGGSRENLMKKMQQDLKDAYGYQISFEIREMPVWTLTANSEAKLKLKSKGAEPSASVFDPGNGITLVNMSPLDLLVRLCRYLKEDIPYYEETGITTNIDIVLDADMTSLESIQKGLQKNGLDLVKVSRKMKVMVIRDPIPLNQE